MNNKVVGSMSSAGSTQGDITARLTGLTPGATYYYQAYANVPGTGHYASDTKEILASSTRSIVMPSIEEADPVIDEDWLELPACKVGSNQHVVTVSYGGERNYTHMYDTEKYVSLWTAYPLESKHMGSYDRPNSWSYNPSISSNKQPNLCDKSYYDSDTYSRGHLIPNSSRNGIKEMQLQTFYVTNSAPQVQNSFNGGIWQSLEGALQTVAKSETIYIVTGVAFNKVGESRSISYTKAKDPSPDNEIKTCAIPNYFYKVVLKVKKSGNTVTSASTIGFWFENKAYSDKYYDHTVSVDQIEQWTGFDFFVNLPDSIESTAEQNTSWDTF